MTRVLFVCVKNSGKSQMAAGQIRHAAAQDPHPWQVESAGTQAGTKLNGLSVASSAEVRDDIARHVDDLHRRRTTAPPEDA